MTIGQLLSKVMEEKGFKPSNIPKIEGRTATELSKQTQLEKEFNAINDNISFKEIMNEHDKVYSRN